MAHSDSFNCHYESEILNVGSILTWMKEDTSPIIFESDEVQEAYLDNQAEQDSAEEA
nr:hypothetical protein [Comamonas testosteroni]